MWAQFVAMVLGLWLMAAPAVLGYAGSAATLHRIVGPTIFAFAFVAASAITRGVRWMMLPAGLALVVLPWLLGFAAAPLVNSLVVGALTLVLAPLGAADPARFGGGWRALVHPDELGGR